MEPWSSAGPQHLGVRQRRADARFTGSAPVQRPGEHMIPLRAVDGMSSQARDHYGHCVLEYADDLAHETQRIEWTDRATGVNSPEINTSMVQKANKGLRSNPAFVEPAPRSLSAVMIYVTGAGAGIGTGIMASFLHSPLQIAAC